MSDDPLPTSAEARALPGDELIADARKQITREITIDAPPEAIWPWLREMAHAGGEPSHALLRSDAPRALVLGALYDHRARRYLAFDAPRPEIYWQATWALVLTPLDAERTLLAVRSRVAYAFEAVKWAAVWMHPFHDFMDADTLHGLKRAAEGAVPARRAGFR